MKAEALWRELGWRIYYNKSAEMGWFTEHGKNPIESVFYSDFEQWIEQMTINRGLNSLT